MAVDEPTHSLMVNRHPQYSMKRLVLLLRTLESKEEEEEERIFKVSCTPHAKILTDTHIHTQTTPTHMQRPQTQWMHIKTKMTHPHPYPHQHIHTHAAYMHRRCISAPVRWTRERENLGHRGEHCRAARGKILKSTSCSGFIL